jgi:putative FmdB family regulatory protein
MPLYEYECKACRHRFEMIQKYSDPPVASCPVCGAGVQKLLSSPAIQFKGSGWYITDYARKGGNGSGKETSGKETAKSSDAAGESTTSTSSATPAATPATSSGSGSDKASGN